MIHGLLFRKQHTVFVGIVRQESVTPQSVTSNPNYYYTFFFILRLIKISLNQYVFILLRKV